MQHRKMELCLLVCVCITMAIHVTSAMHVTQTFRDPDGQSLHTAGLDRNTGDIIVGATQNLVKLSENLLPKEKVTLNKLDNTASKAVVVDSFNEKVIFCKSGSGSCDIHLLKNLSKIHYTHHSPLVPKDNLSNTILFMSYQNSVQVHLVNDFIWTRNPDSIYTISSRNIQNLDLVYADEVGSTALRVLKSVPDNVNVQYIYGFSQGNFIYLISNQPKSANSNFSVSTIARLCKEDKYYRSYVEIQLDCLANSATKFQNANTAHYDPEVHKLLVGFSQDDRLGSALCVFDLTDIDKRMDQTVKSCYAGNGVIGPVFFHKRRSCVPTVSFIVFVFSNESKTKQNPILQICLILIICVTDLKKRTLYLTECYLLN